MLTQSTWVEVLVDSAYGQGLFTYMIPPGMGVNPGDIVAVGFGSQQVGAIAIRVVRDLPPGLDPHQVRPIEDVVAKGFFSPHYWRLLAWVTEYYQADLMGVIRTALPPGLLRRSQTRIRLCSQEIPPEDWRSLSPIAQAVVEVLRRGSKANYSTKYLKKQVKSAQRGIRELREKGWVEQFLQTSNAPQAQTKQAVTYLGEPEDLTARQREILTVLRHHHGEMWLSELVGVAKTTGATLHRLAAAGAVAIAPKEALRLHTTPLDHQDQAKSLTAAQRQALETIQKNPGYQEFLLHGVTGSGKTEVYLQAIAPILAAGKSALVLVPEIGLTPQLLDRFQARFGQRVLVYHSGLSTGERYDTWRKMLREESHIVIGTRSAVFSPLRNLGMVILDEEHDSSYKQDQKSPYYHARAIAQWRAEQENCPLILGSATPALDTWVKFQADSQRNPHPNHHYLALPERIQARPLPPVQVVDMRHELRLGNRTPFSQPLQTALQRILETKEQGILFVSRRGHSTFVSCRSCGYKMMCPNCDVTLAYHYVHHGAAELLRCHYCDYSEIQPKNCPDCGSPAFKFFGNGTQKVRQALNELFPDLRCLRFDSDTTRRKGAYRDLLGQFSRGEADILLGTQMLTKGLDIEQVTLVGIVAADGLLFQNDFRAAERTFQTLTQVAGRAGRGEQPGQVILQTYSPDDPVIQAVKTHDYLRFAPKILEEREVLNYPPFGQLVLLRFSGENEQLVQQTAEAIAEYCDALIDFDTELLGPVPANIVRIANRYRWQIVLKFPKPQNNLPNFNHLREFCPRSVNLSINVDPLYLD